jgi:hypothetical protein
MVWLTPEWESRKLAARFYICTEIFEIMKIKVVEIITFFRPLIIMRNRPIKIIAIDNFMPFQLLFHFHAAIEWPSQFNYYN